MPFASRVASFATLTFSVLALVAQSTPGLAADLPALAAATTPIQLASPAPVPSATVEQTATQQALATVEPEEQVAYPTLAAAVADQSVASNNDEDLRCLAGAIYFESRGEPLAGQLAVAEVILNRTQSRRFRGSVCDVITQRGQFSFVRGGRMPDAPSNDDWRTAVAVAKVALKDAWESGASTALYFNHRSAAHGVGTRVASIGNHIFYR